MNKSPIPEKVLTCAENAKARNPGKTVWVRYVSGEQWYVHTHGVKKAVAEQISAMEKGHTVFAFPGVPE